jgi:hypothetical protein
MAGYSLELDLQDSRMRPFSVPAEFDVAHDRAVPQAGHGAAVINIHKFFDL